MSSAACPNTKSHVACGNLMYKTGKEEGVKIKDHEVVTPSLLHKFASKMKLCGHFEVDLLHHTGLQLTGSSRICKVVPVSTVLFHSAL